MASTDPIKTKHQPSSSDAMTQQDAQSMPDPVIEAYKKDVDRTLIRENLRLSVEQRFEKLMRLQEFADELRRGGRGGKTGA
jgi:hypothetical protein